MEEREILQKGEDYEISTREERLAEGEQITQMIEFSSVVPERENLPYYIITIDWFTRWQKYTGCFNVNTRDAID